MAKVLGHFLSRNFRIGFACVAALLFMVVHYQDGIFLDFGFPFAWISYHPKGGGIFPGILDIRNSAIELVVFAIDWLILYWCVTIPTNIAIRRKRKGSES